MPKHWPISTSWEEPSKRYEIDACPPPTMLMTQPQRAVKKTTSLGTGASTTLKVRVNKTYSSNLGGRPTVSRRVPNPSSEQLHDYVNVNRKESQRSRPPASVVLRQKQRDRFTPERVPDRNIQVASFHQDTSRPSSATRESGNERHVVSTAWNNTNAGKQAQPDIKVSFRNNRYEEPNRYQGRRSTHGRPKTSRSIQQPAAEQFYNYTGPPKSVPSGLFVPKGAAYRKRGGKQSRVLSVRPEDDPNRPLVYDVEVPRPKQQRPRYQSNSTGQSIGKKFSSMEITRNRQFHDSRPDTLSGESTHRLARRFDKGYASSKAKFRPRQSNFRGEQMVVEVNGRRGIVHFEKSKRNGNEYKQESKVASKTVAENDHGSGNMFECRSKDIMATLPSRRGGSRKDNVLGDGWFKNNLNDADFEYDSDDSQESWRPAWNSSTKLAVGLKKRLHGESKRSLKLVLDNNRAASKAILRRKAKKGKRRGKELHENDDSRWRRKRHNVSSDRHNDDSDYDKKHSTRQIRRDRKEEASDDSNYSSGESYARHNRRIQKDKAKASHKSKVASKRRKRRSSSSDDEDDFWSSSSSSDGDSYARYRARKHKSNTMNKEESKHDIRKQANGLIYRSDRVWPSQTLHQLGQSGFGF